VVTFVASPSQPLRWQRPSPSIFIYALSVLSMSAPTATAMTP
jgi:hypothetical protein